MICNGWVPKPPESNHILPVVAYRETLSAKVADDEGVVQSGIVDKVSG